MEIGEIPTFWFKFGLSKVMIKCRFYMEKSIKNQYFGLKFGSSKVMIKKCTFTMEEWQKYQQFGLKFSLS